MDSMTGSPQAKIVVDIRSQTLQLITPDGAVRVYPVSTAKNGTGEQQGSGCTPRGRHIVRAKIGAGCAEGTVLVGRRETGEIYTRELAGANPNRDWILTRILWLSGVELGKNRLGSVDTMQRYIYIHGCPDDVPFDKPASHGCIRMRNADIIELFDLVAVSASVEIHDAAERLSA
jgi:lipoprotein-anchoring transpeptidase ErfK/SrfK